MKKLNKKATQIFCSLISQLEEGYKQFTSEGFLPLSVERIGGDVKTPWGIGSLYSLCHYYKQQGDLMQDPEMCFIVVDNRSESNPHLDFVGIYPYYFKQANVGCIEESAVIENNSLLQYKARMQADHTAFANIWLSNIKEQGFIPKQ